jgi:hypothetical protein
MANLLMRGSPKSSKEGADGSTRGGDATFMHRISACKAFWFVAQLGHLSAYQALGFYESGKQGEVWIGRRSFEYPGRVIVLGGSLGEPLFSVQAYTRAWVEFSLSYLGNLIRTGTEREL